MASGYTFCGCRDCMAVTVSSDIDKPELCSDCKSAECERPVPNITGYSYTYDCQRDDAYSC